MRTQRSRIMLWARRWAASVFVLLAPAGAGAVQIFIDTAFVHRNNANCVVTTDPASGALAFRCPPYNDNFCGSGVYCTSGNGAQPSPGPSSPSGSPDEDGGASTGLTGGIQVGWGNISNNPQIQFERVTQADACHAAIPGEGSAGTGPLPPGTIRSNVCNQNVFLCASVGYSNTDSTNSSEIAIDEINFEVFKFLDGSNPLDPSSTPPLRTYFIDSPGFLQGGGCTSSTPGCGGPLGPFCVLFDGNTNIQGEFGKTNGQYGFRAQVKTNQTGSSGNITITAIRAYPTGATFAAEATEVVPQLPITVDVTNVHVVRSSPTLVGSVTAVTAQPYNITYRLSKDATMFMSIVDDEDPFPLIRNILAGVPRVGEGTPNGTLQNGDSWDGRDEFGQIVPPSVYMAVLQAFSKDQFGDDLSLPTTRQISIDPLQVTDIRVQPILAQSTSLAVLDYVLTEPATVFIDIYPPSTQFCRSLNSINANESSLENCPQPSALPPLDFLPTSGSCGGASVEPVKRIVDVHPSRQRVVSFWDGRAEDGTLMPDGNYVFVIYAALPSQRGSQFCTDDRRVWTDRAKSGFLPVTRGLVEITQVTPASTIIGSSPPVSGVNPFRFRYGLSRDATVNLRIYDASGQNLVRTLVENQSRSQTSAQFIHEERWTMPLDNDGLWVSSGTYMMELTAFDQNFPGRISTTTALFPVDPYRVTDVATIPLLPGTSELAFASYQLTQNMLVGLTIYPPGTQVLASSSTWPPCGTITPGGTCPQVITPQGVPAQPVRTITGLRAGRLRVTEQWDARDETGLSVPDGAYTFVLAAETTTTPKYFATDRHVGIIAVQRGPIIFPVFEVLPDVPIVFHSSVTETLHPFTIQYSLTRQSSVTIQILNTALPPQVIRTVVDGETKTDGILIQDVWDGRDQNGQFPPPGFYIVRALATDVAAQLTTPATAQVTISFDPLQIYDLARSPLRLDSGGAAVLYQVSEPMKVAVKIYRPGTTFDSAGNPNPPESVSLVKRIIGVKPDRTLVEDVWDGTDLRQSLVPDGIYKFKIVASTDIRAIDDITGNVLNPGTIIETIPEDLSVVRNGSLDPASEFANNTFVFPNPVTGPNATIQVHLPFQGIVKLRIYNIAGELVYSRDVPETAPSFTGSPVEIAWNRLNAAGKSLARGIYYVVVRAEETLGGRSILQTVKKVVIP